MKYRKKPVVIEAITFDELVAHGLANGANVVNGIPWSWQYNGHPITHENDNCYLIPTLEGTMKMGRDDMLITGVKGEIYPCKREIFAASYDPAGEAQRESVTLSVAQIIDLAEMAGLRVSGKPTDADDLAAEVTVERCPPKGVDDDGTTRHYRHIAYFEEYPEEGVCPLGMEIPELVPPTA